MPSNQEHVQAASSAGHAALLSFFLGPVQPFIAGARSVRDLWTGSYLLAWLTFAAIQKVREVKDVRFVSPSLEGNPMLWTVKRDGAPPPGITTPCLPNRFTARIPAGTNAHDLAAKCEKACHDEWIKVCENVRQALEKKIQENRAHFDVGDQEPKATLLGTPWDRLWKDQISSFFEVRTAVLFPEELTDMLRAELLDPNSETAWQAQMDVLAGLLDARKSVRHVPSYEADGDVPQKCTLLGTYEQMGPARLEESRAFWAVFARRITIDGTRVRKGERLCAVSLVKRFAWPAYLAGQLRQPPEELRYSDTATVAAGLWLPPDWRRPPNWSGQWLHWSRPDQDDEETCPGPVFDWIRDRKNEGVAGRKRGGPPTYYAILMADADRLGDKLTGKGVAGAEGGEGRSEKVSKALTEFALHEIRDIIEAHKGELIYSGGDDTLAVGPTESIVACAREVQRRYAENWKKHFPEEEVAKISAGVAVVHYKEDLRFAMEQARNAERLAKGAGRDALAVAVCRRSGEHTSAVLGWGQAPFLAGVVDDFIDGVSDRWAYALRAELSTLQGLECAAFKAELGRLLNRIEELITARREAFLQRVLSFWDAYHQEMACVRERGKEEIMADFVTLCQTASFLARGEGCTMSQSWRGLRLDPLDTLFCRDGRPFDAAARVVGGLPTPQTLAGALRTALLARTGFEFRIFSDAMKQEQKDAQRQGRPPDVKKALRHGQPRVAEQAWIIEARFRGPWLALARKGRPIEPLLPPPATLVRRDGGGWLRARPREGTEENRLLGWSDKTLLPLWRRGKPDTKAGGGLLTSTALCAFLNQNDEDIADAEFFRTAELFDFDDRTGIRVDMESLTSEDGQIYGIRMLSLKPWARDGEGLEDDPYHKAEVCLYAEISPGAGAPADLEGHLAELVPLGGEGRYVRAKLVDAVAWPKPEASRNRALWYLATPAFFDPLSGLPQLRDGLELRAAASGPGIAVSGWDVARNGPRPTRFAVPAGAVYFVEGAGTHASGPFQQDDDALAEGWGFALQGAWK